MEEIDAVNAVNDCYRGPLDQATVAAVRTLIEGSRQYYAIVVFGGECRDGKTFSENEGYDLATGNWKTLKPAEGRHGFGAATVGDRTYFVAGALGCGGEKLSKELLIFTLP